MQGELTKVQARVMSALMQEISGQRSIAQILTMRPSDVGLSLRQLERLGLVELTYERINRAKSEAIGKTTFIGRVVGAGLEITITESEQ